MITDTQRHQLAVLDQAKTLCESAGIIAKVAHHGVLLLVLPIYGDEKAEQLFLEATEPGARQSGHEGRSGRNGEGQGAINGAGA